MWSIFKLSSECIESLLSIDLVLWFFFLIYYSYCAIRNVFDTRESKYYFFYFDWNTLRIWLYLFMISYEKAVMYVHIKQRVYSTKKIENDEKFNRKEKEI